ncbi:MAG: hypothetical protein L0Y36_02995 [Planctomycetales bacterium]|nr:hypothetical protein [Planctomycetales bacterium]
MRAAILFQCLLSGLWLFTGCEVADPNSMVQEKGASNGLKLSDLQDTSPLHPDAEFLIELRVLTYALKTDSADALAAVFAALAQTDVRCANRDAFAANGLAVGTGRGEQSARVAQMLYEIGAVRIGQTKLLIPPDQIEVLSRSYLPNAAPILYSPSRNSTAEMNLSAGSMGWIMSARPDPRLPKKVQLNLVPAYWQQGGEDLRLWMGKPAVDYQPVQAGQVLVRIEEGSFVLLGPARTPPDQTTLDKILFFLPARRPQVQFFVIICDKAGL